jgi:uncharacterized protein YjhX (UPF0386 family)
MLLTRTIVKRTFSNFLWGSSLPHSSAWKMHAFGNFDTRRAQNWESTTSSAVHAQKLARGFADGNEDRPATAERQERRCSATRGPGQIAPAAQCFSRTAMHALAGCDLSLFQNFKELQMLDGNEDVL